ncbi:terminal protein [Streptomyces sp. NPDC056004]
MFSAVIKRELLGDRGRIDQMYFRANNSRAHGLGVEFIDVEHIQIDL